jgi:hypothetical protein
MLIGGVASAAKGFVKPWSSVSGLLIEQGEYDRMAEDQTLRPPTIVNENDFLQAHIEIFNPLSDDHPCYALVGLIASEAARIEHFLDQAIANVSGMDHALAACLTGQMIGPNPRFSALLQLARQRALPKEVIATINRLSGRASGLFERRNRAVHDPWWEASSSGAPHQFRGKPKKDETYGLMPKNEQALRDDLTEIRKCREEVTALVSAIWTALR